LELRTAHKMVITYGVEYKYTFFIPSMTTQIWSDSFEMRFCVHSLVLCTVIEYSKRW